MLKSSKPKTKKGSSIQSSSQKGHPVKPTGNGQKTKFSKSKPGFSLYSDEELQKAIPKPTGPVTVKHDPTFEAAVREEDIVSQVQWVDKKNNEKGRTIPISSTDQGALHTDCVSPDFDKNPVLPDVRTPFNKRLISSTPDPERLISANESSAPLQDNVDRENPSSRLSPQMVPEKDTEGNTKSTVSIDKIASMLSQQRQNQLIWQQQLEQFKLPVVMKVIDKPSSGSAFQSWQGKPEGITSGFNMDKESKLYKEQGYEGAGMQESLHKAKWVSEDSDEMKDIDGKPQECNSVSDSSKRSEIDSMSYNAFGATSAQMGKSTEKSDDEVGMSEIITFLNERPLDPNVKSNEDKHTGSEKIFMSKSKPDANSQGKISSSKIATTKSKIGVKVLPVTIPNAQASQAKSLPHRKMASKKPRQVKIPTNSEQNGAVKKKKILHINLPRDERGTDVPPTSAATDEDVDCPKGDIGGVPSAPDSEEDAADVGNDSFSTCSGEVNTLLSKESDGSCNKPPNNSSTEKITAPAESSIQQSHFIKIQSDLNNSSENLVRLVTFKPDIKRNENKFTHSLRHHSEETGNLSEELKEEYVREDSVKNLDSVTAAAVLDTDKFQNENDQDMNVNQNYHDEEEMERRRSRHFKLHFLEKMADKTLLDIACRLTLKATAVRDKELRDLIDDMIFHTDATLAREVGRFQHSHSFLMEDNNKLKKRLHNVNKQLDAKERQEKQADLYPGISNSDVMHLERKNLYLRQEKDRLDNQVTNLLEEKAQWLVKQQDLVKTISIKDREILKLEEKHQEDRKNLHKSVDEAAKNSQGIHFKLSVADMEIANLEQRLKAKDQELMDLKDSLKDMEEDLKCCTDSRREKNKEIQRLQDLVNTLKVGVDEVMKAYESTAASHPSTTEQRQGIESLRRLVTESLSASTSLSNIPEQIQTSRRRPKSSSFPEQNDREFSMSTSTRFQLPSAPKSQVVRGERERAKDQIPPRQLSQQDRQSRDLKHHFQRPEQPPPPRQWQQVTKDRHVKNRPQTTSRSQHQQDSSLRDSSILKNQKKGTRSKHDSGTTLTVEAVEDHNRRLSPVDRSLWHSLDTGHVMPPFTGEEPYHSDSEIHVSHFRNKRRMNGDDLDPDRRLRQRRRSDDYTHRERPCCVSKRTSESRPNIVHRFEDRDLVPSLERRTRDREIENVGMDVPAFRGAGSRHFEPSVRNLTDFGNTGAREELESVPVHRDNESDMDGSRYSVSDYFRKYPKDRHQVEQWPQGFPMSSKDYWIDSGTGDDQDAAVGHPGHDPREEESRSLHPSQQYPSLESMSVSDHRLTDQGDTQQEDSDKDGDAIYTSTQRQPVNEIIQLARPGNIAQAMGKSGPYGQPLSTSYPDVTSHPLGTSKDQYANLMSTSLPYSPQYSENTHREYETNPARSANLSPRYHSDRQDPRRLTSFHEDNSRTLQDAGSTSYRDGYAERTNENCRPKSLSQPQVTFRDPSSEDSLVNPSRSFQSDFLNGRSSFPPHSSPVNTSDISISRRATRGSETSQQDFFRGTELSASYSSISESDQVNHDYSNNQIASEYGEESFNTGIASLDSKIAQLEAKINRTKAVFS